ncbi:MAG: hypothetical protein J1F35_06135 [Erysipelotrichales bacterium]|nr:hypothetical protein [Erysipelotrichales bacterium]
MSKTKNSLTIFNEFGITPTTTYTAAGLDFYVPDLYGKEDDKSIWEALSKSFKVSIETLYHIGNYLRTSLISTSGLPEEFINNNTLNLVHLYCALDTLDYEEYHEGYQKNIIKYDEEYLESFLDIFEEHYLIIPNDIKERFGIKLKLNNTIFFNSGIRTALPKNTAGVFLNKSGKGNQGFDVRSQVVDEDYTGLVHISMAYTKPYEIGSNIRIGDKIIQMLIIPIYQVLEVNCIDKQEYDKIMEGSERGDKGFGSSDIKN